MGVLGCSFSKMVEAIPWVYPIPCNAWLQADQALPSLKEYFCWFTGTPQAQHGTLSFCFSVLSWSTRGQGPNSISIPFLQGFLLLHCLFIPFLNPFLISHCSVCPKTRRACVRPCTGTVRARPMVLTQIGAEVEDGGFSCGSLDDIWPPKSQRSASRSKT